MKQKLQSRKFWAFAFTAAVVVVFELLSRPVPWELVALAASYIFGEGAADVVGRWQTKK